jgi:proline dehydrogenase
VSDLSEAVFRPVVLKLAGHPLFRRLATRSRPGRALARRFVAGETLAEAMDVARGLDRARTLAMLDHLGENVTTPALAVEARDAYLDALAEIRGAPSLDCAISVKLTQLGLDASVEACIANLQPVLQAAGADGTQVMIDMESHLYVDRTLEVLARVRETYPNLGICLQAYLRRTERDIFDLPKSVRVRLVKGAYLEPPDVVYQRKEMVDAAYARLFTTLLARGHRIDAATHDPRLIEGVRTCVDEVPEGWGRVEFQMLYGVRRDLQAQLAGKGYPLRVYIPYGTEWYPYLTRRLAERPANLRFFLSNIVRGARRG